MLRFRNLPQGLQIGSASLSVEGKPKVRLQSCQACDRVAPEYSLCFNNHATCLDCGVQALCPDQYSPISADDLDQFMMFCIGCEKRVPTDRIRLPLSLLRLQEFKCSCDFVGTLAQIRKHLLTSDRPGCYFKYDEKYPHTMPVTTQSPIRIEVTRPDDLKDDVTTLKTKSDEFERMLCSFGNDINRLATNIEELGDAKKASEEVLKECNMLKEDAQVLLKDSLAAIVDTEKMKQKFDDVAGNVLKSCECVRDQLVQNKAFNDETRRWRREFEEMKKLFEENCIKSKNESESLKKQIEELKLKCEEDVADVGLVNGLEEKTDILEEKARDLSQAQNLTDLRLKGLTELISDGGRRTEELASRFEVLASRQDALDEVRAEFKNTKPEILAEELTKKSEEEEDEEEFEKIALPAEEHAEDSDHDSMEIIDKEDIQKLQAEEKQQAESEAKEEVPQKDDEQVKATEDSDTDSDTESDMSEFDSSESEDEIPPMPEPLKPTLIKFAVNFDELIKNKKLLIHEKVNGIPFKAHFIVREIFATTWIGYFVGGSEKLTDKDCSPWPLKATIDLKVCDAKGTALKEYQFKTFKDGKFVNKCFEDPHHEDASDWGWRQFIDVKRVSGEDVLVNGQLQFSAFVSGFF